MEEIHGFLDSPVDGENINKMCKLSGWAFSEKNEIIIKVFCDETLVYETKTGMPRFDAFQKFPENENSYRSGFLGNLHLNNFLDGPHVVRVIAEAGNQKRELGSASINLKNDPNLKVDLACDNVLIKKGFQQGPWVERMIKMCNLKPNDKILEIGPQYGRLVLPFTNYLNEEGKFEGIDIIPDAIYYVQKHISSKYSNFHFTLANIYNKWYNPEGKIKASEYKLPYQDNWFDFVYLVSVFTHMLPDDMKNYLKEIFRVLKNGGHCFITYFLINENSLKFLKNNPSQDKLKYQFDGFLSKNKEHPEAEIGYDEELIKKLYHENGFKIIEPIHYGNWTGINAKGPQDFIIATKI